MDRFEAMKIFIRVADLQSFTKTSETMGLPKASISNYIQGLEKIVNTKLLNRTTRHVSLTPEGMIFYEKCKNILSDLDETESMFSSDSHIKGKIRVDMSVRMASKLVIPLLPKFLKMHPDIEIELSSVDRKIDLVREDVDCAIRIGYSSDIGLVEKNLGEMIQINCASPEYIEKYGIPKNLEDIKKHKLIYYSSILGSKNIGFEYFDGNKYVELKMKGDITVNNTNSYLISCLSGLGIAQLPNVSCKDYIKNGNLIEIIPDFRAKPLSVNIVYPYKRIQSKRVRVFIEWISPIVKEYIR